MVRLSSKTKGASRVCDSVWGMLSNPCPAINSQKITPGFS
jgi:hypothetical protein